MPTDNEPALWIETNSQRYGHDKTTDEVYEDRLYPKPHELRDALAATEHLTEKHAAAFVYGYLEPSPAGAEIDAEMHGFESKAEFESYILEAKHMIAQAIWIYELIDAYRSPDFPDECRECGNSLGGTWVEHPDEGEPGVLCRDRAGIDPDDYL